jgi:hypothetical protein
MATITPIAPGLTGAAEPAPPTPTAADVIPAAAYKYIVLVVTSTTGTPTVKVDDPTTPAIAGATTAADPDLTIGPLAAGNTFSRLLPTARYRDASGNINITTTSPANSTVKAYGIPA